MGLNIKILFLVTLYCLVRVTTVDAQKQMTLAEAWEKATSVSQEAIYNHAVYGLAEAESKMGVISPFFNTVAEAGQINSALFDTRIMVSQSGYFPGYHKAYQKKQEAILAVAGANKEVRDWEIKKFVGYLFLQYNYLTSVKKLYQRQDSLYQAALERAQQRVTAGETDGVEVMEASAQLSHVQKLKQEAETELMVLLSVFRMWTSADEVTLPAGIEGLTATLTQPDENSLLKSHPTLKRVDVELAMTAMEANWKRAQRQPMWMAAVSNTSFRGTGADNRSYDAASRFTSVQLGISLPLLGRQTAKTEEVIRMSEQKTGSEKVLLQKQILQNWKAANLRWQQLKDLLAVFEIQSLPLASKMMDIARNKLENGEIDFMKYAFMTGQAQALLLDHASLKKQVHEAALECHFVNP